MYHNPVLLHESIAGLNIKADGIYVDATYGGGGHSKEILGKLTGGKLIAFDQDEDALENKIEDENLILVHANFRFMRNFLKLHKLIPVDGILADLGISSHQIDIPERGFSTRFDADLDMRMNKSNRLNGAEIINDYPEKDLQRIFRDYGEISNYRKLAALIIKNRAKRPIIKISELKDAISGCYPISMENKYLAKVFQAIRIEVNQELEALKTFLQQSVKSLKKGGRIAVITYHSLEDRIVKNFFKAGNFDGEIKKDFYGNPLTELKVLNRKPVRPSEEEMEKNRRSRSAKLRIAEKI